MSKTQIAIINLFIHENKIMDVNEIYICLNPNCKRYSYAAVYRNVRVMKQQGLLVSEDGPHVRRSHFSLNDNIVKNLTESDVFIYNQSK